MGQHWSHLTPTKRIQLDAFIRAGMKPTDIAKELGVHHTTIYRELKRCTYEHRNSDYTTEIRYNPDGAQARYEGKPPRQGPGSEDRQRLLAGRLPDRQDPRREVQPGGRDR